ncbi:Tripartite ATP-independent periplasmic transporter, DctQ component [Pseudovibrio axinellae]|uniref:TRAP transporter small permease protein n=1 Tax=Pseudovibrio axinellae TaxID=989403 RepID=A0A166A8V7_9HYPH|nr:TRAP transporter small permease subunit [Pseudovibrio axinellae]KZL20733.1 Tripartite ATP-independent periplasmic transporter, DctQ component [Pseudovibrio axinellae]SER24310.1 TRAP-type mannitol/chloroaromatic compound transport system, small permease component [Pseudovibrio axinellae]
MRALMNLITSVNSGIGKSCAWLSLGIVLVQFTVVVMRYVFGIGSIWMQESITYMHGFLFMLAAAYTLSVDGHVRVDIFYRDARPRIKAMVDLVGSVFFLLPMCAVIIYWSWGYVASSWSIWEGSQEASGIQGRYLLKSAIIGFAVLVGLQGIAIIIRSVLALGGDKDSLDSFKQIQE